MKVANNLINNVQTLATCEALAMGLKFGLEPSQMFDILNVSTGRNSQTEGQLRSAVLENDFSKGAVMTISQKDITLAVDEAQALGVLAATAQTARDVIDSALATGGAQQRSSNIFRYVAGASGIAVE
jgi:3-hydroxyisobutyrate dehydrogenase-like beta-hydroxyacid dehydrogenase